jgi:gluconolactonase
MHSLRRFTLSLFAALTLSAVCIGSATAQKPKQPVGPVGTTWEPHFPDPTNNYPLTDDSRPKPGVPQGTELQFEIDNSRIYPATKRTIRVYVPAQYDPAKPACVFVFLDNIGFGAKTVFDNLIAAHQMPITIAVGISPGSVEPADGGKNPRADRSFEFDNRTGRLASFILDEVLPAVEAQSTKDGRAIHLSHNPDDRAIGGASTGGIAALNAALERPDAFHRVFTNIGTFVDMRGGSQLYVQVRKTEPKPLRVFMVDGVNDGWPGGLEMGDWFMANLTMERALEYAGYDVRHLWGQGTHNGALAAQTFPDAIRWLYRDYPAPIKAMPPNNQMLKPVLIDGQGWQLASTACAGVNAIAADASGHLHFSTDPSHSSASPACPGSAAAPAPRAFVLAPNGAAYSVLPDGHTLATFTRDGARPTTQTLPVDITALAVRPDGDLYMASRSPLGDGADIWLARSGKAPAKIATTPHTVSTLAFLPDGKWLMAAQPGSHLSYSFRVLTDGSLDAGEPFYDLYAPADADGSGVRAVAFDTDGHAFTATSMGVQILDRNGRVTGILPLPANTPATSLTFGGDGMHTLYVLSGDKLYTRRLQVTGTFPAAAPIVLSNYGAG